MTTSISTTRIVRCTRLASISAGGGAVERELVTIDGTPIVLLHKTHPLLQPHFTPEEWKSFSQSVALPKHLQVEADDWNRHLRFSLNCHTVAIGSFLEIAGTQWLEGSHGQATLMANPAQDLLDQFFIQMQSNSNLEELDQPLQDDDVIVFRNSSTKELVHSGRIRIHNEKYLLLSKFGEHPVAVVSLKDAAQAYLGQYDTVVVYRWNSQ